MHVKEGVVTEEWLTDYLTEGTYHRMGGARLGDSAPSEILANRIGFKKIPLLLLGKGCDRGGGQCPSSFCRTRSGGNSERWWTDARAQSSEERGCKL
jgi:hypothetical protein